jgi:hypothetical protein
MTCSYRVPKYFIIGMFTCVHAGGGGGAGELVQWGVGTGTLAAGSYSVSVGAGGVGGISVAGLNGMLKLTHECNDFNVCCL